MDRDKISLDAVLFLGGLLLFASAAIAVEKEGAPMWETVFEDQFNSPQSLQHWHADKGEWSLTPGGLRRHGVESEAVLRLKLPVIAGAVRIEFEAKSDNPGDLSLIFGMKEASFVGAAFFGFGSKGNTLSKLDGGSEKPVENPNARIVAGQWHRITATREGGKLTLAIDGKQILEDLDVRDGYPGAQIALYLWNDGVIRSLRVSQRDDAALEKFISADALKREKEFKAALAANPIAEGKPFRSAELFVSPNGNDNAAGTKEQPLATITAARDKLRALRKSGELTGSATVWLRGGRYAVESPLEFTAEDSGTIMFSEGSAKTRTDRFGKRSTMLYFDAPVQLVAMPGETPIVDGGRRITNWRAEKVNGRDAWVAELPEVAAGKWNFRQLFVNGQRRTRPRLPKKDFFWMEHVPGLKLPAEWGTSKQDAFICKEGDIRPWKNLTDVEVVVLHFWIEERFPIVSFDEKTRLVKLGRTSRTPLSDDYQPRYAKYYADNVFEALIEPGQWYLDRKAGKLYYLPLAGEDPKKTEVVAPRGYQLLKIVGNPDENKFVENLRFVGITFQHTDWRHPGEDGSPAPVQNRWFRGNDAATSQSAVDVPGVIYLEGARNCFIEDCAVRNVGWYGIDLADGCTENRIVGNDLYDLGGGGVKLNGADATGSRARRTGNNRITDNHIHEAGRIFHSACGVIAMHSFGNVIVHNRIEDLFYTGISVGWVWGYAESVSRDNLIEKNHIHNLGQGVLSDMGGIYLLGVAPGTVVRGNLIHDIVKASYGGWAIYPDEGSSHLIIENNICYRTNANAFHQHYGRENIVRNNIFAFADEGIVAYTREETHIAFTMERNILISNGSPFFKGAFGPTRRKIISDLNLFWDTSDKAMVFNAADPKQSNDFAAWQALGFDQHSLVADPKFRDLSKFDFALLEDSPALKLGFQPIDLSDVGPRPKNKRN